MKSVNSRGLAAAILGMSAVHMSVNAISPILEKIREHTGAADTSVQFLMTFPFLFVVAVSLLIGFLDRRVNKKLTAAVSLTLAAVSGLGAYFFHGNLPILYVWSALLGISIGLVGPVCTSLIADWYEGKARESMLGYQTSAQNLFSIVMTYCGGLLASVAWHNTYLVYLLVIPGLVLTLLFVPGPNRDSAAEHANQRKTTAGGKLPMLVFLFCGIAMLHMLLFFIAPTNAAMLVNERGLGDERVIGTATTLLTVAGLLAGLVFGRLATMIGRQTITLGYILLAAGFAILQGAQSLLLLYIGMFVAGMSNAFIIPQCMAGAVRASPGRATLVNSLIFSLMNIGTFLAPLLTDLAALLSGTGAVGPRFILAGVLSVAGACVFGPLLRAKR